MNSKPLNPGDKPLRRKTPLQSREPLKAKQPLKRSAQLERNTGLKPRSDDTAKFYREVRAPLVARLLEERPHCEAKLKDCTGRSEDVNEICGRGRSGGLKAAMLNDDGSINYDNLMCVCRSCHTWITAHPVAAEVMGLTKHSWDEAS